MARFVGTTFFYLKTVLNGLDSGIETFRNQNWTGKNSFRCRDTAAHYSGETTLILNVFSKSRVR